MESSSWKKEAAICQAILENSIPKQFALPSDELPPKDRLNVLGVPSETGQLLARELEITESDGSRLVSQMATGHWTAEEVTLAYLKRATMGQQMLNFATEFLATEAVESAKELDRHFKLTGTIKGPLHGVPVSVKEHIGIGGKICHTGYVALVKNVAPEDALAVQLLRKAGAVILLRTNEPQSLMVSYSNRPMAITAGEGRNIDIEQHGDTDNNITGPTFNPWNRNLSAGGSSGGEGSCIAFKGSAIGVGTDIGGSIRIPSSFNGVYGFRPTALRVPYNGVHTVSGGQEALRSVIGPLARSVDDLELFMRSILLQEPWDISIGLVPVPWAPPPDLSNMTVAVMHSNRHVTPTPPMRRALKYAEKRLQESGIRTVEWLPYRHQEAFDLLGTLFFADGAESHKSILAESGEPVLPLTEYVMSGAKKLSFAQYWECNTTREMLREEYHKLMKDHGVDVILCAPTNGSATRRNNNEYWFYTGLWNILDQPAAVFPTGLVVDPKMDPVDRNYVPLNDLDAKEQAKYDPGLFAGSPLCLQVAGKHMHDEEVLAATRIIERIVSGSKS